MTVKVDITNIITIKDLRFQRLNDLRNLKYNIENQINEIDEIINQIIKKYKESSEKIDNDRVDQIKYNLASFFDKDGLKETISITKNLDDIKLKKFFRKLSMEDWVGLDPNEWGYQSPKKYE